MKRRSNLLLYIVLNIIVSAATTLAVLTLWDNARRAEVPPPLSGLAVEQVAGAAEAQDASTVEAVNATQPEPVLTPTLPPLDKPVIQISAVIGVGDLSQEFVLLKRLGEGNLLMTGWSLSGERGSIFIFPAQPELTLYKDGAVQIYTKTGDDTATEVYWDREAPAWESGETLTLLDSNGAERSSYVVP
jgi:hypothetical protein